MNTYCINLDTREDRWENIDSELSKLNLKVYRFPAIWHKIGHKGCIRSHLNLIDQVKSERIFMIIEDDIKALGSAKDIINAYSQLPANWDLLYLGATLIQPLKRYSPNLFELKGGLTTHAIIYNNQNRICDYILKNHNGKTIDDFYAVELQYKFNCFIAYPMIITQAPGFSDIVERHTDYSEIEESYNKYTI